MDHYFVDQKSKRIFYIPNGVVYNNIHNEALIMWCAQYLSPQSTLIDCDANIGGFSILLSSVCQQVVAFEKSHYITNTIKINNIKNIKIVNHEHVDELKCDNVSLIVIQNNVDVYLKNMMDTILNNNYPYIVYYEQDDSNHIKQYLTTLEYHVYDIMGCPNWFLAGDHKEYKIKQSEYNDDIVLSPSSSQQVVETTLVKFFSSMIKLSYKKCIMLHCPMGKDRVPNNPAILKSQDGYLCNIRASNYVYDPQFRFLDQGTIHKSDHYMLTLNDDFCIIKTIKLVDKTDNVYYSSFVEGIDDLRLINNHMFICSHGQFSPTRVIKQCLGTFNDQGEVTKLIPLKGPNEMRHEKNWLPFIKNDILYVIYTLHPFVLYEVQQDTGDLILIKNQALTNLNLNNFRGSAPPVDYKNGYLMTAHQACQSVMNYFHRFIWIDQDFTTIKISFPFYFQLQGVEFNCGLALSDEGVMLTHSVWDNNSRLIVVDYDTVNSMLKM
jgi:hypothetical protein